MLRSRIPLILFVLLPVCLIVGGASAVDAFWSGVFFAVLYLIFVWMTKYVLFDD